MYTVRFSILLVAMLGMLSACNQAKSPGQVARDTAAAQAKAEQNVSAAEDRADRKVAEADARVDRDQDAADRTFAEQAQKVAQTKAKGDYDTTLAQCESLGGSERAGCRSKAKDAYDAAMAKASRLGTIKQDD
jgi:hypothetical protein